MPHANPVRNAQTVKRGALLLLAAAILAAPVWAQAPPRRTAYATTSETCDGWPRAQIGMAKGYCAGIVVAPPDDFNTRTLRLPRVLLPLPFAKIDRYRRRVRVNAILGSQFADVPATRSLDQVTKLEEDRIVGYYGAGTLYATPARQEPLL